MELSNFDKFTKVKLINVSLLIYNQRQIIDSEYDIKARPKQLIGVISEISKLKKHKL